MSLIPPNENRPVTIEDIKSKLQEYFVLADEGVVELALACFVANKLSTVDAPVWLLLVAESSGGKTEIIDMFSDLQSDEYKLSYSLSDLSTQTFVSGMQNNSVETSLLHKINGRMVFIKDFTTILSKNKEERKTILGQFREIYDGEVNKDFGTGKSVKWKGRVGIMAGLTPPAVELMSAHGSMGERFIAYFMKQPTDKELAIAMREGYTKNIAKIKSELRIITAKYIASNVLLAETADFSVQSLSDEILDTLNEVGMFATHARSQMNIDFRTQEPIGLPSIERFPRFTKQLQSIAKAFCIMNGNVVLTELQKRILAKIALDSIPRTRRALLRILTQYKSVSSSAAAARFGFTTPVMRGQLAQLASLKLVQRIPRGNGTEDTWRLITKYRVFMENFDDVQSMDDDLFNEDDTSPLDDEGALTKEEKVEGEVQADRARRESAIARILQQNKGMSYETASDAYDTSLESARAFEETPADEGVTESNISQDEIW